LVEIGELKHAVWVDNGRQRSITVDNGRQRLDIMR